MLRTPIHPIVSPHDPSSRVVRNETAMRMPARRKRGYAQHP